MRACRAGLGRPSIRRVGWWSWILNSPRQTNKHTPPVLCYYGVGKPTERAYIYKTAGSDGAIDVIDAAINDPRRNISDGVLMGEGDGTVSLLSLGYHCAKVRVWVVPL